MPLKSLIKPGTIINIMVTDPFSYELTATYMKARERMVLGIPLDPDLMDEDDWDAVPGIGPKIAQNIIKFRQVNDGFHSLEALKEVSGLSEGKINKIKRFF